MLTFTSLYIAVLASPYHAATFLAHSADLGPRSAKRLVTPAKTHAEANGQAANVHLTTFEVCLQQRCSYLDAPHLPFSLKHEFLFLCIKRKNTHKECGTNVLVQ